MRVTVRLTATSFPLQLLANVMLYLCAAAVGVMSYYMADRKYRTAFLEARQSLEVKLTLDQQGTQQVNSAHADTQGQLKYLHFSKMSSLYL